MKVCIIDYGMGNIGSVRRALQELGADPVVKSRPEGLESIHRYILPGVGSFADGMCQLQASGWTDAIEAEIGENKKPLLGICLGMQLLSTAGEEGAIGGMNDGLKLIKGEVVHLNSLGCTLRVPHVGWNSIFNDGKSPLMDGIPSGTDCYFVHSYAFRVSGQKSQAASCDYGVRFTAVVEHENVVGTQFHPEKSSKAGFRIISNYLTRY